jgi:alkanesulfonate monooxygenase SsuD/methylene tetrahydromethanopterin reductase-like flavin-dependent oxidoreductase (luciferase family)
MQIGIGLPNVLPGTNGELMVAWAKLAEERGFAFLSTVGRLAYPSYDSLISLAVAAGATSRIGLLSNVVLAPLIPDTLLAKSTLALSQLSGDRLTLGVGLGARASDYEAVGADYSQRGPTLDRQLELLHRAWKGEPVVTGQPVGPPPATGARPQVLIGGHSAQAVRRVTAWGDGWTGANGGLERNGDVIRRVREAWREAGRDGTPRIAALMYFSVGEDVRAVSRQNLAGYYGFFGPERATTIAQEAARDPDAIRAVVQLYADSGFTDLTFIPTVADLEQVDRLADVVL